MVRKKEREPYPFWLPQIFADFLGTVLYDGPAADCYGGAIVPFGGNDWLGLTLEPTLEPVELCPS